VRFFLDQNVDTAVRQILRDAGHECWTADQAGLGTVDDDDIAIYAHDRSAVLVTHDHEFSIRRRRRTFGQHIYLRCPELDAAAIVKEHLTEIERVLRAIDDAVLTISRSELTVHMAWE
jgi:predicted nuclease of predicted toxin-antitoxin system